MAPFELSFLYQTRTILRSSLPLVTSSPPLRLRRIHSSKPSRSASSAAAHGFFQEKAKELENDKNARPKASSITGQEKKVFNRIFETLAKADGSSTEKKETEKIPEIDTDHKRVLGIFSSSMKDYHAEQQRKSLSGSESVTSEQDLARGPRDREYLSKYPRELRWAARKAAEATNRDRIQILRGSSSAKDGDTDAGPMLSFKPYSTSQGGDIKESNGQAATSDSTPTFMRPSLLSEIHDIEEAFVRLPFARDIAIDDDSESVSQNEITDEFDRVVDNVAEQEMTNIAQSFDRSMNDAAATHKALDAVIWEVCERRIFPLLDDLDTRSYSTSQVLEDPQVPAQPTSSGADSEIDTQGLVNVLADETSAKRWVLNRLPAYIPPLSILSRLYPAALLLALRLYAKHCPISPYALAILPHVRAQGATNYVLGGTTPFYNTLIKLQWEVYSNLREINGLLTEMEKSGIELDVETYDILVAIGEARWTDINRPAGAKLSLGCRKKSWWESSVQVKWFGKVCVEWRQLIATRLIEQGLEVVSEREYGRLAERSPHFDQGRQQEPAVWI